MERTSRNIKPYAAGIITAAALSVSPKISEETGLFEKILYEMNGHRITGDFAGGGSVLSVCQILVCY